MIFLIESTLILLVFKKYKKIRKIKIYKKRSWRTKFENLTTFLPINTSLLNTLRRGNFETSKKYKKKKKKTLNLIPYLFDWYGSVINP